MADATVTLDIIGRDRASAALQKVGSSADKTSKRMDGMKRAAGVAGAAMAALAIKVGKDSVDAASNLAETMSKTRVIFGKAAPAVEKFAGTAAESLGQSKQQALDAAGSFATFGKSAGLTGGKLTKFSTGLVSLTSDMASFSNTTPEEAIEAVGAALRGESEPIRKYGVLLDEATLKAEAMSLGLVKNVKSHEKIELAQQRVTIAQRNYTKAVQEHGKGSIEAQRADASRMSAVQSLTKATEGTIPPLTQQQKVLAAQSSILKQTTAAQGDFARTSDGLANKSRILKADLSNMSADLGAKLLPVVLNVVTALGKMADFVQRNASVIGPAALAIGGFALAVLAVNKAAAAARSTMDAFNTVVGLFKGKAEGAGGAAKGMGGILGSGGVWGVAIAAGVAALGYFAVKHQQAKARIDEMAASLNQATGAITRETRASTVNTLEKSGALKAARSLGVSLKDVTSAALGNEGAIRRVNAALDANRPKTEKASGLTGARTGAAVQMSKADRDAASAIATVSGAISSNNKTLDAARAKISRTSEALGGMGAAANKAGRAWGDGLAAGIAASGAVAVATARGVANKIIAETARAHQTSSPSKVAIRLGGYWSDGLKAGIEKGGKAAIAAAGTLAENIVAKVQSTRDKIASIRDSVGGAVRGVLDVSAIGAQVGTGTFDENGAEIMRTPSARETIGGFAEQAKAFASALAEMARKKLAPAVIAAVAAAGPVSGLTAAQALAQSSAADVAAINSSMKTINQAAGQAANTAVNTTRLPAELKREQEQLATLRRIEDALKAKNVAEMTIKGSDLLVVIKREEKKAAGR